MTTSMKLALANKEVNRIFTRKLTNDALFYTAVMHKVAMLIKRCQEQHAYALWALHQIEGAIHELTNRFYDEIDKLEGVLEKKKHLFGKAFQYTPCFHPEVDFNSSIAADLVEFFDVYDRLISTLKTLRSARGFANDNDYYHNLRRYFRDTNRLLSRIQLTKIQTLPIITFVDVVDNSQSYQDAAIHQGPVDPVLFYQVMTSSLAPRLEEPHRQSLLHRLKTRIQALDGVGVACLEAVYPV